MKRTKIETHIEGLAARLHSNLPPDEMAAALLRARRLCRRYGHDWSVVLREAHLRNLGERPAAPLDTKPTNERS